MKYQVKDITGQQFGRLTVLNLTGMKTKSGNAIWLCRCECGTLTEADSGSLRVGYKTSCGCAARDHARNLNKSHGGRNDRLYLVWTDMRRRCRNEKDRNYPNYGGRGIAVCDEWQDYAAFKNWAMATGYDAAAEFGQCTLDRINVDGNYEPGNCRWVSSKVQQNNRRSNKQISFNGKVQTLKMWTEELGVDYSLVRKRLSAGWTFEKAISKPSQYMARQKRNQSAKAV